MDGGNQAEVAWRDWIMGGDWEGYNGGRAMRRWRGGRMEREAVWAGGSAGTEKEEEER